MIFNRRNRVSSVALALLAGVLVVRGDLLEDGRMAFLNYDFEEASELYAKYAQQLKKKPSADGEALLEKYMRQLEIAENSLENVQKIEVIDRIDVPVVDFFKKVMLPAHGGKLLPPDKLPFDNAFNESDFIFGSESGDFMMWTVTDANGISHLVESERLLDGTWDDPVRTGEVLNDGGSVRNPFMLTDGITLYFAGDGDGSMGGYDLFVATKDPASGEFRQPLGVGFPFNSPYNEYLMAIDEENGIGWWVTDRHQLNGMVSIYVYKSNEVRKNYDADEVDDIVALALLDDITLSQNPSSDYASINEEIQSRAAAEAVAEKADFYFPLPGGRVITHMSGFRSASAKRNMAEYLKAKTALDVESKKLSDLRRKYHDDSRKKGASQSLISSIKELETKVAADKDNLKKLRNAVIAAETQK